MMVYSYKYKCFECNEIKTIYYTVADFGDSAHILQCKHCCELYCYTPENEVYLKPLDEQLIGLRCVECNNDLSNSLVPTHKGLRCCGEYFSLEDDFMPKTIPPNTALVPVEIYLIYS
jgi:hypothetical protein